jgi:RHS repeat-associated protein
MAIHDSDATNAVVRLDREFRQLIDNLQTILRVFVGGTTSSKRRASRRQVVCVVLALCLMTWPDPNVLIENLPVLATTSVEYTMRAAHSVGDSFRRFFAKQKKVATQESLSDRMARVSKLRITPSKFVGYVGDKIGFTGLPLDHAGRTIQGLKFTWQSSDNHKIHIEQTGQATFLSPGLVKVVCQAGSVQAVAFVLSRPGPRPRQTDYEWKADQGSLQEDGTEGTTVISQSEVASLGRPVSKIGKIASSFAHNSVPMVQTSGGDSSDFPYDELWSDPRNLVGSPAHRPMEQTSIGSVLPESSNFRLQIPLIDLEGRGVPVSAALYYNSRIWSRHGNAITFNPINTWPYLGFSIGFGRIVTYGSNAITKFLLIDSDGTRHYLGSGNGTVTSTYQSTDGNHITYVGSRNGGTIYRTNGVSMNVGLVNNRLLVTAIKDTNGNFISISYANQSPPQCNTGAGFQWKQAIDTITDTMGRIIQFNYDSCNNLISITSPGLGGNSQNPVTNTIAQFDYLTTFGVSTSFNGLTVENAPAGKPVVQLNHVYFPGTQTGYKFQYSAYGMIYNISKRRQMTLDSSGNISDGVESAHATFNYPQTAASLTDAPSFNQRFESPGSANPYQYLLMSPNSQGANTQTIRITSPDASSTNLTMPVTFLTRSTDASSPSYGLLVGTEITDFNGKSYAKTNYSYGLDPGGSSQVVAEINYDDTGKPTQTTYSWDAYGNQTDIREFGYQVNGVWQTQRRTHSRYITSTDYVNAYIRNRLIESDVFDQHNSNNNDAAGVLIAKTTYSYDNYALMGNMENYGGDYDGGSSPPGYDMAYNNQALVVRGNLTGTTEYSDPQAQTSSTFNTKIDIFGNTVQEQVTCCSLTTNVYSANTYWSAPDQVIKGDPNGVRLTKLLTHDFNTSVTTQETDPNGFITNMGFDSALRPIQTTLPTGATNMTAYGDGTLSKSSTYSYTNRGTNVSGTRSETDDGAGRPVQQVNVLNGETNTTYDSLGRVQNHTTVSPLGTNPGPTTTYQYDPLGRTTLETLPDGSSVRNEYAGNLVTTTDQVGRKSQRQLDGLGRVTAVIEQDSSGALVNTTIYSYDFLDNLVQINSSGQTRSFKYDSLGRKLFERMPEQTATINDGTGTMWSSAYTYTSFGAVASRRDARGVVTSYSYDGLNRLTTVTYDTSNAIGVLPTNNVTYSYDTDPQSGTYGLLLQVSMTGPLPAYQEVIGYDSFNMLSSRTWSRDGQTYSVHYQKNAAGNDFQFIYPSGRAVTKIVNSVGSTASLIDEASGSPYVNNLSYDITAEISGDTLGNGVTETFGHDSVRHLLTSQVATKGANTLMNLTYNYQAAAGQMGTNTSAGNAGQLIGINGTINGAAEAAKYGYDNVRRLVTSSQSTAGVNVQRRFTYDRWGNRTGTWNAVSGGTQIQSIALRSSGGVPTNQIQSVSGGTTTNYIYDAAGNLIGDGVHTYGYDAENRFVNVDNGSTAQYAYDHRNQRIKKTVGLSSTHYIWDENRVVAEHNAANGSQIVDYVYLDSRFVGEGTGNSLAANSSFTFFLSDRLSTRLSTDRNGNVIGRQAHLPFGEDWGESGAQEKHHFTTYERDNENGLDYAVNRYHRFNLGRFDSIDPVPGSAFEPQSLSRYAYSKNDPINNTDPLGQLVSSIQFRVEGQAYYTYPKMVYGRTLGPLPRTGPDARFLLEVITVLAGVEQGIWEAQYGYSEDDYVTNWANKKTGNSIITSPGLGLPGSFDTDYEENYTHTEPTSIGFYLPVSYRMKRKFFHRLGILYATGGFARFHFSFNTISPQGHQICHREGKEVMQVSGYNEAEWEPFVDQGYSFSTPDCYE